jgi:hypothetical protein
LMTATWWTCSVRCLTVHVRSTVTR